jgi:hypothetical protein
MKNSLWVEGIKTGPESQSIISIQLRLVNHIAYGIGGSRRREAKI